jgi:hypothetical protein
VKITEVVSWENAIYKKIYAKNVCQMKPKMGLGKGSHVRILPSFFITNRTTRGMVGLPGFCEDLLLRYQEWTVASVD